MSYFTSHDIERAADDLMQSGSEDYMFQGPSRRHRTTRRRRTRCTLRCTTRRRRSECRHCTLRCTKRRRRSEHRSTRRKRSIRCTLRCTRRRRRSKRRTTRRRSKSKSFWKDGNMWDYRLSYE